MNIQHSSRSDRWFTPKHIVHKSTKVLRWIDLDPCSEAEANERVKARHYLTKTEDGLTMDWGKPMSVYCNPPGSKREGKSNMKLWWQKFLDEPFGHGIFMAFSVEALQSTQSCSQGIMDFTFCVPAKRLRFEHAVFKDKSAPSHSNVIVYVPKTIDRTEDFVREFSDVGKVRR